MDNSLMQAFSEAEALFLRAAPDNRSASAA